MIDELGSDNILSFFNIYRLYGSNPFSKFLKLWSENKPKEIKEGERSLVDLRDMINVPSFVEGVFIIKFRKKLY